MKNKKIKRVRSFIITMFSVISAFVLFSAISLKSLMSNDNTIWRLILVEYPPLLLGIMFIEFEGVKKVNADGFLGSILRGIIEGTILSCIISYVFAIEFITDHTTLYSKIVYIGALLIIGYILNNFLVKRKCKLSAKILALLILILVPGGIIINESFGEYNVHTYNAVVENCEVIKTSKSTKYNIYFKEINEDIPLKKYTAKDIHDYNRLSEGSVVKIKKYTGILGLPAIEVEQGLLTL